MILDEHGRVYKGTVRIPSIVSGHEECESRLLGPFYGVSSLVLRIVTQWGGLVAQYSVWFSAGNGSRVGRTMSMSECRISLSAGKVTKAEVANNLRGTYR